jgi:hypothetical protein
MPFMKNASLNTSRNSVVETGASGSRKLRSEVIQNASTEALHEVQGRPVKDDERRCRHRDIRGRRWKVCNAVPHVKLVAANILLV